MARWTIRTLPAFATAGQQFYIGTTQVAINRASDALTLAGITLTTPDIGAATGTSLALGADPADDGVIRLSNATGIYWEDGTEAYLLHVNDVGLKTNLDMEAASFTSTRTTNPQTMILYEGSGGGSNKTTITTEAVLTADATITFGEQS